MAVDAETVPSSPCSGEKRRSENESTVRDGVAENAETKAAALRAAKLLTEKLLFEKPARQTESIFIFCTQAPKVTVATLKFLYTGICSTEVPLLVPVPCMRLYKACASHMDLVYCTVFSYLNYYYPYTVYKCHSFIFPLPLGTDTGTLFCLGHFILPERCAIPVMCTCKIVPILVLLYCTLEVDIVLLLKYFH